MRQLLCLVASLAAFLGVFGGAAAPRGELTVRTLTGTFTGLVNDEYKNVREFRNIPYAQPPLGKLRWSPPVALTPSGQHHYSYRFPPACVQYLTKNNTVWNSNITDFAVFSGGQSLRAGVQIQTSSEDCLSLALWTPLNISSEDRLPVAIFLPGGSFTNGGVHVNYQMPAPFISRTPKFLVATVGYRLNIFGFPTAAGLEDNNLGILDQRMAIEWLHSNVASFGGDPDRMILWGHSAGAASVDVHNYAYPDNPLVKGFYMMSGTAAVEGQKPDPLFSNFTFVAKNVGCDFPNDSAAELNCMRQVPTSMLSNFIGGYQENSTRPSLTFKPMPDEKVIFRNYSERAAQGHMAKLPALVSTTANEDTTLIKYPVNNVTDGPWMKGVDKETLNVFVCPAANTTEWRRRLGLTTYRYQYTGTFPSITPLKWMGAYHAADIPYVFGTIKRRKNRTDFEDQLAEAMQDFVYAFIEDPENGLKKKGWLPHSGLTEDGGYMMRFVTGGSVHANISSLDVDRACYGKGDYNNAP